MEIKAVKFRKDGFYTQPFIFGGEDGADKYPPTKQKPGNAMSDVPLSCGYPSVRRGPPV